MKTAISVIDAKADRHRRVAERHGLNRSEFYTLAGDRYADELEGGAELTAVAEAVIARVGQPGDDAFEFRAAARATMFAGEW